MDNNALFGLSALMGLVVSSLVAKLYVWPRVRTMDRNDAVRVLAAPHMFRFIGLSFLVPGVVSPSLPSAFALMTAYGDFIACLLAIASTLALSKRASWAIALVWVFNVWGTCDLLNAGIQGPRTGMDPGALGAAFYIPTVIVPALVVTHVLIFLLLLRRKS